MAEEFNIKKHILVPEHFKLSEDEKNNLLKNHNIKLNQLPMILESDVALGELNAEIGDVIKIIRDSPTNIKKEFYRVVVHG
jgi:DNA-directed RNA polymerase subunit H (RpoH/RPB5)